MNTYNILTKITDELNLQIIDNTVIEGMGDFLLITKFNKTLLTIYLPNSDDFNELIKQLADKKNSFIELNKNISFPIQNSSLNNEFINNPIILGSSSLLIISNLTIGYKIQQHETEKEIYNQLFEKILERLNKLSFSANQNPDIDKWYNCWEMFNHKTNFILKGNTNTSNLSFIFFNKIFKIVNSDNSHISITGTLGEPNHGYKFIFQLNPLYINFYYLGLNNKKVDYFIYDSRFGEVQNLPYNPSQLMHLIETEFSKFNTINEISYSNIII
jgi:hypothetical protein